MVFVSKLDFSLFRKSIFQLCVNDNFCNITLFEDNTVLRELMVQLSHHLGCHIGLKIKNVYKPHTLDEISDIFFNFCSKELIKSTSTEFVNEILNLFSLLRKSESEMEININISIILGWASLNWSIIVNNIFGKHACNSLIEAIAPVSTSLHDTS